MLFGKIHALAKKFALMYSRSKELFGFSKSFPSSIRVNDDLLWSFCIILNVKSGCPRCLAVKSSDFLGCGDHLNSSRGANHTQSPIMHFLQALFELMSTFFKYSLLKFNGWANWAPGTFIGDIVPPTFTTFSTISPNCWCLPDVFLPVLLCSNINFLFIFRLMFFANSGWPVFHFTNLFIGGNRGGWPLVVRVIESLEILPAVLFVPVLEFLGMRFFRLLFRRIFCLDFLPLIASFFLVPVRSLISPFLIWFLAADESGVVSFWLWLSINS